MHDGQRNTEMFPALKPQTGQHLRFAAIAKLLSDLAIARQAALSEECARVYIRALTAYDLQDLQAVMDQLAIEPRREFRTAFPDLGAIVARVKDVASRRTAAAREEEQRRLRDSEIEDAIVRCAVEDRSEGQWKGMEDFFRARRGWDTPRLRREIEAAFENAERAKRLSA